MTNLDSDKAFSPAHLGHAPTHLKFVRVDRIIVPESSDGLELEVSSAIAESIQTIGLLYPITVRIVWIQGRRKRRKRFELVTGGHRLHAVRCLGLPKIPCFVVNDADDVLAKQIQIGEDLFRKEIVALDKSELIMAWYDLQPKARIIGHVGQKRKRGRPRGGDAELARNLPLPRSVDSRRKMISRAKLIARIKPEAKYAIKQAGLDNNEKALLTIAKETGTNAQLEKVVALTPSVSSHSGSDSQSDSGEAQKPRRTTAVSIKSAKTTHSPAEPTSDKQTTLDQLKDIWAKGLRDLWRGAPLQVRAQFMLMLRKTHSRSLEDAIAFVKAAFKGRKQIPIQALLAASVDFCVSPKRVRKALSGLRYRRKRPGRVDHYVNINKEWACEATELHHPALDERRSASDDDFYKL